ncbi:MAG: diaminopimelate epimerase [bacterium]|nr:diaminopimelate epimerase [bacterium]
MIFYKTVSSGNDFLHIRNQDMEEFTGESGESKGHLARQLCRRQNGAGADGVIYYSVCPESADFEIFNRDGTGAELSGNGMAGLSALLLYLDEFKDRVTLNTRGGRKTHQLLNRDGSGFLLDIEIGEPDFRNSDFFPFLEKSLYRFHEYEGIRFYPVSVGNPHVVVLLENVPDEEDLIALNRMGQTLESAALFPQKTNVELVFFKNDSDCRVFYYERGVGPTFSSSTGSAAVFAVLQKLGLIRDRLTITTQGGEIKIYGKTSIHIESFSKIVYKGIYMG